MQVNFIRKFCNRVGIAPFKRGQVKTSTFWQCLQLSLLIGITSSKSCNNYQKGLRRGTSTPNLVVSAENPLTQQGPRSERSNSKLEKVSKSELEEIVYPPESSDAVNNLKWESKLQAQEQEIKKVKARLKKLEGAEGNFGQKPSAEETKEAIKECCQVYLEGVGDSVDESREANKFQLTDYTAQKILQREQARSDREKENQEREKEKPARLKKRRQERVDQLEAKMEELRLEEIRSKG